MKTSALFLVGCLLWLGAPSDAQAHVPYVTYYQPVTVYSPPVVVTPHGVHYAPAPHTVYYAPVPTVSYRPVARVRTRYRPLLGGTVTRVRYRYAPVYHSPAPVAFAY
jgi:hypothetical protein